MQGIPTEAHDQADDPRLLAALEPEQFVAAKRRHYGRRRLSSGTLAAMWGLRIYTVLMVFVVIYSVVHVIRAGR